MALYPKKGGVMKIRLSILCAVLLFGSPLLFATDELKLILPGAENQLVSKDSDEAGTWIFMNDSVTTEVPSTDVIQSTESPSVVCEPECSVSDCCPDDICQPCMPSMCCGGCCCRPMVPFMLGDGGLLQPRMIFAGSRVFFMQNHTAKVAENNSPLPQDRFGFQFNALERVPIGSTVEGGRVHKNLYEYRMTAEKTLFSPYLSADLIVPIYQTTRYQIQTLGEYVEGPQMSSEFGNLAFGLKGLLLESECSAFSLGVRVEAPTHRDISITIANNSLEDQVWHFTPYIAAQTTPTCNTFVSFFGSYRMNSTTMSATGGSQGQLNVGVREATYLMADLSAGYWLVNRPCCKGLTSLAPVVELHYTTTPTAETPYSFQGIPAEGYFLGHTDYLNLTAGLTAAWNEKTAIGAGFAFPLRRMDIGPVYGPSDQNYDWAFMFNINYRFGCRQ